MSPAVMEVVTDFLARLGAAEQRVADLERAMAAQRTLEGRVAPITRRAHQDAQERLTSLLSCLRGGA